MAAFENGGDWKTSREPNPDEPPLRATGRNQIATDYADYTDSLFVIRQVT
jgi:hypothetical protein